MTNKLAQILDNCIRRISDGEAAASCLADYPRYLPQLEPLLDTAFAVTTPPREAPSEKFIQNLEEHLRIRYQQKTAAATVTTWLPEERTTIWQNLGRALTPLRRVALPATIVLLLLTVTVFGASNLLTPAPSLAAQGTLGILSGSTEFQKPGSDRWQRGTEGMTLTAGTRIRTSPGSSALLTFFEGSTIKLEPETELEITELSYGQDNTTKIMLKQQMGRTWSRVVKMLDTGSQYEIETPSAIAMVRGTLFTTDVNAAGDTKVTTTEGLVSVSAADEEVLLPPSQLSVVATGKAPSAPEKAPEHTAELKINVDRSAVASVIDPSGASTGYLPGGLTFNQITGSQSSLLPEGEQTIIIPQPMPGDYTVILRYPGAGATQFNIEGTSTGGTVFNYGGKYEGDSNNGWRIRINLQADANGVMTRGNVTGVEPLGKSAPEKIVLKPTSEKKPAVAVTTSEKSEGKATTGPVNNNQGTSQVASPDTGQKTSVESDREGIPISTSDEVIPADIPPAPKSTPGDKDPKVNEDNNGNQGNNQAPAADTGQNEDKGNAQNNSKQDDSAKNDDKGNAQNNGKQDDNANNNDRGNAQNNSKQDDNANNNDRGNSQHDDRGRNDDRGNNNNNNGWWRR